MSETIARAKIEARQRANGCNQDDEPGDWGRPLPTMQRLFLKIAASTITALAGEMRQFDPDVLARTEPPVAPDQLAQWAERVAALREATVDAPETAARVTTMGAE